MVAASSIIITNANRAGVPILDDLPQGAELFDWIPAEARPCNTIQWAAQVRRW